MPVTVVKVGPQSADTAGADEFDMDSQVSTIVSGGVSRLYMYNIGSLVDAEVEADFARFVSQNKARALSASIGGCEINSYLDGSEVSTDVLMQEGAMQGQSLFASSGDNGDACMYVAAIGAPAGVPGVNWPASGEFDTAVGGTSLISDDDGQPHPGTRLARQWRRHQRRREPGLVDAGDATRPSPASTSPADGPCPTSRSTPTRTSRRR